MYVNKTTHLDSVVRFSCDQTYALKGPKEVTCLDTGDWSGAPPKCEEIRCIIPERPNNTVVSISSRSSTGRS